MSLVAYGASDDSDASDTDDGDKVPAEEVQQLLKQEGVSSSEGHLNNNNNTLRLPVSETKEDDSSVNSPSQQATTSSEDALDGAISDEEEPTNFLKALPQPKPQAASSSILDITEDDELEDIVKPKPSQLADIVKPVKKDRKGRQPVKISIPALSKDWDEEDEPRRKKIKSSTLGSGLTALLPAPKNVCLKETNRLLLPHTLKKTPQSSVSSKGKANPTKAGPRRPRTKPVELVSGVQDSESDEEGDSAGGSFFSFGSDAATPSAGSTYSGPSPATRLPPVSVGGVPLLTPSRSDTAGSTSVCGPQLPTADRHTAGTNNTPSHPLTSSQTNPGSSHRTDAGAGPFSQDLPLSFRPQSGGDVPLSFKTGPSVHSQSVSHGPYYQSHDSHMVYHGRGNQTGYPEVGEYYTQASASDMEKYLQDEEFLKLQGKKQQGREQINFIDIDTNEFTGTQDLMKTLTVEQEHTSHRKKENQPSGRQRSKHQITYLAFQAKERELTLKNQWAQNRQTKRQTQSKYGF